MNLMRYDKYNESFRSNKDLHTLVDILISKMVKETMNNYEDNSVDDDGEQDILNYLELVNVYHDDIKNSSVSETMKLAIQKTYIVFFFENKTDGRKGSYYQVDRTEILSPEDNYGGVSVHISEEEKRAGIEVIDANTADMWAGYINMFRTSIIHELQHWYDDARSNGEYDPKSKEKHEISMMDTKPSLTKDEYLKLPYEISARYTQTLTTINAELHQRFDTYYNEFKNEFEGWDLLTPEQQQRLIKRLKVQFDAEKEKGS